jgi:ADP-ribosylglycohydrolase
VRGEPVEASIQGALIAVEDRPGGEELEFLVDAIGESREIDGPDRGFCLFAAGAALQAPLRDRTFEAGLLGVVGLGGDTGANAAAAGALLGAIVGSSGLPGDWLGRLQRRSEIEAEADALGVLAERESD